MFMFGLVTCLQGLTQNYSGILATRFFLGRATRAYIRLLLNLLLGAFESGMFPGCFYLLAMCVNP